MRTFVLPLLSKMETVDLFLSDLNLTAGTQGRSTTHDDVVRHYAELDAEGVELPPILVVMTEDGNAIVYDGFHRAGARMANKRGTITAIATRGTIEDAQFLSLAANKHHGLQRMADDIKAIVARALEHPRVEAMTNKELADHIGISERTLNRYKNALGKARDYKKVYAGLLDDESVAAVRTFEKQFPEEAEAILNGELVKSKEQLVTFSQLPSHQRVAMAPLFLGKNLSVEASRDAVNLRPVDMHLPMAAFLRYSREHPEDATFFFEGVTCRVDIVWVEDTES